MKRRRQFPLNQPNQDSSTGSPSEGGPVFLAIGFLRRPHGIKGEIVMDILTDFPERIRTGKKVYVGDEHEPLEIVSLRSHDRALLIRFAGFQTPEEVGRLRNQSVFSKAAELPQLPEGEYYHHQLLGLAVIDEQGKELGILEDILETGANDVYLVKSPAGKELLLPALEDVILDVNLERREMRVRPPDWL
ncbi:MAG: 16S rRNA processing protein RimM [Anaerolineaceae bacterium]|nr:16S rRNA processing protein RimM [Anaerolineaceae bacterium]